MGAKSNTITKVKIKDGTTQIIENAFYESSITEVTIPGSVIYWYAAFHNARVLEKVIIEEGVTSIDDGAFSNCLSLKEITLPISLQFIHDHAFTTHGNEPVNMRIERINISRLATPEILERIKKFSYAEIVYYD